MCHQNTYKSFTCNNIPLLVCARCSGIYLGAFLISILVLISNIKLNVKTKYLIMFSLPMLIDVILLSLRFYNCNKMISAFTGFLFGSVVFIYILSGIENLLFTKKIIYDFQKYLPTLVCGFGAAVLSTVPGIKILVVVC